MEDNQAFRELFTLPPVQESANTSLTIPDTPAPKSETGDREVDAVLWLQECIRTGHPALIEAALTAAKKIATPMKDVGQRYSDYLLRLHRDPMMAALGSMGFGELESQAQGAIKSQQRKHLALSRFITEATLFSDTSPEALCKKALRGLKRTRMHGFFYEPVQLEARFSKYPELVPYTLADCLYGQSYWHELYWLRAPFDDSGDAPAYAQGHEDYCFALMAKIAPHTKQEALSVFEYMEEHEGTDREESPAIIRNLISGGWA